MARRVLIAFDDSSVSRRAAHVAADLFGGPDTEFLAINVADTTAAFVGDPMTGVYAVPAEWWEGLAASGLDEKTIVRETSAEGVPHAEALTEQGSPVDRICFAAEKHAVDVIVVGSHHKGFLRRMLEPSVSEGVLHRTSRPVLIVRELGEEH